MEKGITQTAKHTLMLDGRSRAKLTGVTAVSCFNDGEVVLETGEGEVAGRKSAHRAAEPRRRPTRRDGRNRGRRV